MKVYRSDNEFLVVGTENIIHYKIETSIRGKVIKTTAKLKNADFLIQFMQRDNIKESTKQELLNLLQPELL